MYRGPPAPRDTAQKWLAFGAIVVVVVGVSFGANALKSRLNKSLGKAEPVPIPTDTDHSSVPPPAPIEPATIPVEVETEPAPAGDEATLPPGEPRSSLRARPVWGRLELSTRGEPTMQFAPQPSKPLDLFTIAKPIESDVHRSFVICRAQSFAKADTFAGDDLHVRATFGKTPEVAADGPEDGNLGFVSAPLVSLAKNDIVHIAVFDRDVFELTNLARVNVTFKAAPILVADPGATIECRVLQGDALQRQVAIEDGRADASIQRVERTQLLTSDPQWDYPHVEIFRSYRAIGDAAALVGWDDTRVTKRVSAIAAAITKVDAQKAVIFDQLHSSAANETTAFGMNIVLSSVECGTKTGYAGRCAIKTKVTNRTTHPVRWGSYGAPFIYVATRTSGPVGVAQTPDSVGKEIAPAATLDATWLTADEAISKQDAIAGFCLDRQCGTFKLR